MSYGLEYLDPLQVNLDAIKKMLPEDLITGNSDIVVKNVTIHGLSTLQLKNVGFYLVHFNKQMTDDFYGQ